MAHPRMEPTSPGRWQMIICRRTTHFPRHRACPGCNGATPPSAEAGSGWGNRRTRRLQNLSKTGGYPLFLDPPGFDCGGSLGRHRRTAPPPIRNPRKIKDLRPVGGVRCLGSAPGPPWTLGGFAGGVPHVFLRCRLAIAGLRAHSDSKSVVPRLPSRHHWPDGVFNPAPTLEKEFLYELDDQRSPS